MANVPVFMALARKHKEMFGVMWWVTRRDEDELHFWGFHRQLRRGFDDNQPAHRRFKGLGSACLNDVTALADKNGVTLVLTCKVRKLFQYYEAHGFVDQDTPNVEYIHRFVRKPCIAPMSLPARSSRSLPIALRDRLRSALSCFASSR